MPREGRTRSASRLAAANGSPSPAGALPAASGRRTRWRAREKAPCAGRFFQRRKSGASAPQGRIVSLSKPCRPGKERRTGPTPRHRIWSLFPYQPHSRRLKRLRKRKGRKPFRIRNGGINRSGVGNSRPASVRGCALFPGKVSAGHADGGMRRKPQGASPGVGTRLRAVSREGFRRPRRRRDAQEAAGRFARRRYAAAWCVSGEEKRPARGCGRGVWARFCGQLADTVAPALPSAMASWISCQTICKLVWTSSVMPSGASSSHSPTASTRYS